MSISINKNYNYDIISIYLVGDDMGKKKKDHICKCFKLEKDDLRNSIKNGASTFKEAQKDIKIGTKCSGCKKDNKKRFKKYYDKIHNQEPA